MMAAARSIPIPSRDPSSPSRCIEKCPFAGSDGGGENWTTVASFDERRKLNQTDRQAWCADTLTKIVNGNPNAKNNELLPWADAPQAALRDAA